MNFKVAIAKANPIDDNLLHRLSAAQWAQRILTERDYPTCINGVPRQKLIFAMASGDILVPMDYIVDGHAVSAMAGIDSFRYDPYDRLPVNKDHFIVVRNRFRSDFDTSFLSLGPFKYEGDHHLPDIPESAYTIPHLF